MTAETSDRKMWVRVYRHNQDMCVRLGTRPAAAAPLWKLALLFEARSQGQVEGIDHLLGGVELPPPQSWLKSKASLTTTSKWRGTSRPSLPLPTKLPPTKPLLLLLLLKWLMMVTAGLAETEVVASPLFGLAAALQRRRLGPRLLCRHVLQLSKRTPS